MFGPAKSAGTGRRGGTMQWFPCTNLGPANNWQTAWENLKMFTGDGTVAFTQGNIVIVSQDQDKIYLKLEIAIA